MLKSKFVRLSSIFFLSIIVTLIVMTVAEAHPLLGQAQGQVQSQGQIGIVQDNSITTASTVVEGTNIPKTAATAIAPSTTNVDKCSILTQDSAAFSVFFLSFSGTTGMSFNDICYAFHRQQYDVADTLACSKSKAYAKANPACTALLAVMQETSEYSTYNYDGTTSPY